MPGVLEPDEITEFRGLVEQLAMPDQVTRLQYTPQVVGGRPRAATYVPAGTFACAFSWGNSGDSDRTQETTDRTRTAPRMRVPVGTPFTAQDRVELTHRYGQEQTPSIIFQVEGMPMDGLVSTTIELLRVTT